jgi:hypothetical protein
MTEQIEDVIKVSSKGSNRNPARNTQETGNEGRREAFSAYLRRRYSA